jgi:hypothetical protein
MVKELGYDKWTGVAQVDASDSREISFPDGSKLKTTCLRRGEFDLLAINCFAFGEKWRFAFALNSELPANTYKKIRNINDSIYCRHLFQLNGLCNRHSLKIFLSCSIKSFSKDQRERGRDFPLLFGVFTKTMK